MANDQACVVCANGPLPDGANKCRLHALDWQIDYVIAPLQYAPPLQHFIHELKFAGARPYGRSLGQLLAEAALPRRRFVDALVSVPLHSARLRERGYNQALEIARTVSAALKLPILRAGIVRRRQTSPQTHLDADCRRANLLGAFAVTRALQDRRLAIVDDVLTTGATVNALAESLRSAGAKHVEAWVVARTMR